MTEPSPASQQRHPSTATKTQKKWTRLLGISILALAVVTPVCNSALAAADVARPETVEFSQAKRDITPSQRNAIQSAQQYLSFSAFSRSGLIHQLEYEKFSTADATFAVDSLNVDWNEQAVRCAKQYLDYTSFSRSGLIDQLVYEGFTRAQAEYGANAAY
ncbi:Ltp family lipoprotein [Nocardia sp. NPDC004068]|uniref:Ltp family lipoprotein n=1 Tax=Nocardia sp. NPDC004068 TaxID=3364303 RepID=UPI003677A35B